jgi:hypothetical protein
MFDLYMAGTQVPTSSLLVMVSQRERYTECPVIYYHPIGRLVVVMGQDFVSALRPVGLLY